HTSSTRFFFQAEAGIRALIVTGVQTCALPISRPRASRGRRPGYPMEAEIVNGDDVLEMREAVRHAISRARKDSLPFFLEAKTYRFRGHSVADPAKYRTKEEVQKWMERDPIGILAGRIRTLGIAT